MRRSILPALGLSLLGWTAGLSARTASADPCSASSRHPFFDDQGTLAWSTTLDGAVASARASGRLVFILAVPAGGLNENSSLENDGFSSHLSTLVNCGWPDSQVLVITNLSGRGRSPSAIQTCQSTPPSRKA